VLPGQSEDVKARADDDESLPRDCEYDPAAERGPGALEIGRLERRAEEPLVEAKLDDARDDEDAEAGGEVGAVAQAA